jgi:hypothetical protein
MRFRRTERFALALTEGEKEVLNQLSTHEGEPGAVVVRGLIRKEARKHGLWPPHRSQEKSLGCGEPAQA